MENPPRADSSTAGIPTPARNYGGATPSPNPVNQVPRRGRDGRVRDAEEDDVGIVFGHGDAALAQAGADGRTDPAGTDDVDSLDHDLAPAPNRMPGTSKSTAAASPNAHA